MSKVLIWGGSGGIGSAVARDLVGRGFMVHLVGRDATKLAVLAEELGCSTSTADVEDETAFARVSAEAGESLAGLVYAVGTINLRPLSRLTTADFSRDFRVNAIGAALAVQAALPALKSFEKTASVVFFVSSSRARVCRTCIGFDGQGCGRRIDPRPCRRTCPKDPRQRHRAFADRHTFGGQSNWQPADGCLDRAIARIVETWHTGRHCCACSVSNF